MNRREFLTVTAIGLGSLILPGQALGMGPAGSPQPAPDLALDDLRRQAQAALGGGYSILEIFPDQEAYLARVSFQGHTFVLKTNNGTTWYTGEWRPPAAWQYPPGEERYD